MRRHGDDVLLITGPPLGPEGSLLDRARAGGVPLEMIPPCDAPSIPGATGKLLANQSGRFAAFGLTWCIRTVPRAECSAGPPPGRSACPR